MSYNNDMINRTKNEVDQVVDMMKQNVDKVLDRDHKLQDLDVRADALQAGAARFETNTTKLRRKFFWQGKRMSIAIGCVLAAILIIIIVSIAMKTKKSD